VVTAAGGQTPLPPAATDRPDVCGPDAASALTRRASDILRTGMQLEAAARRWRAGTLH
jgi:hypothetical protein